jgi:hypothetical protein
MWGERRIRNEGMNVALWKHNTFRKSPPSPLVEADRVNNVLYLC